MSTTIPLYLQICTKCNNSAGAMYHCTHMTSNQGPYCAECHDQVLAEHSLTKKSKANIINNMVDLDPEYKELVDKHFWDILA